MHKVTMAEESKSIQLAPEIAVTPHEDANSDKIGDVEHRGEDGHYRRSFTARQIHVSLMSLQPDVTANDARRS